MPHQYPKREIIDWLPEPGDPLPGEIAEMCRMFREQQESKRQQGYHRRRRTVIDELLVGPKEVAIREYWINDIWRK